MNEILIIILVSLGSLFVLLAAIGLVRMPDLYLRISVTTKAATLGIGLVLASVAFYFQETSVTTRILAIVLFILLTAPVAAHLLSRASYITGVPLWKKSVMDELKGKYKKSDHSLSSKDESQKSD